MKIDQIFKSKIIKATKEMETPVPIDKKAALKSISCDINENIFVVRGMRTLLSKTKKLRLIHLTGLRLSLEGWSAVAEGISNNASLYKFALNRC